MKYSSEPYKFCWMCGFTEDEADAQHPLFTRDNFTPGRKSNAKFICWIIQDCQDRMRALQTRNHT